jgi:hypothetical protein
MTNEEVLDRLKIWAGETRGVAALMLFGSRARGMGDALSDWDFHIIAKDAHFTADKNWTHAIGLGPPLVYASRDGVVGRVKRLTVLWKDVDMDFVVLPFTQMRLARMALHLNLHRHSSLIRRRLADLACIARPGSLQVYGAPVWGQFYRRVCDLIEDPMPDDSDLIKKAELFAADYHWVRCKIERGELLAAQRVLHRSLVEINFELLWVLRRRRRMDAWPEARRLERWASDEERLRVSFVSEPDVGDLVRALHQNLEFFRLMMKELVGTRWSWPEGF